VTNDFPPKLGGIQSYLWELWRRLPPDSFSVLTTAHPDAAAFDAEQPFRIERVPTAQLLPTPALARAVGDAVLRAGADLVVVDPALPLGLVAPRLGVRYAVVLHGAEVTVPGRLPVSGALLGWVLRRAVLVVAAGGYPADEGRRAAGRGMPPVTIVPPGVDPDRFKPLDDAARRQARQRFGLPPDADLVLSVSRLVPRKGMDVLIRAAAKLKERLPGLMVAIAGSGRDRQRLDRLVGSTGAPVVMLGAVADADLAALYGCADVFAMLCRNRWLGLEQEGFGIVFLEAAACGVPQVAGASGGAAEAVVDGETGLVVHRPDDDAAVAAAIERILTDGPLRARMSVASRRRAEADFSYDRLAERLGQALAAAGG